jgi:DNA-binding transcriptional MocR family regulator
LTRANHAALATDVSPGALARLLGDWARGGRPLYRGLAEAIAAAIGRGDLEAAWRLPAERPLADTLAVSRTTVVGAYGVLARDGLLESRRGSGRFVAAARRTAAPRRHGAAGYALTAGAHADIDLATAALEGSPPLDERAWGSAASAFARAATSRGYAAAGLPELRASLAERYTARGLRTTAAEILVTHGAQQAISLLSAAFVAPGAPVLVEDPTYFGALDTFRRDGARVLSAPAGAGSALADLAARAFPRLVYAVPTFHNPTGQLMGHRARARLAAVARELAIPVVEDCTLEDLALADRSIPPYVAAFEPDAPIISVGSLSKVLWGGLRVGWIRAAEPLVEQLARAKLLADAATAVPSQLLALSALERLDQLRAQRQAVLRARLEALEAALRRELPGWSWRRPDGGLSLWVGLDEDGDADQLAQLAQRHGVAIAPGSLFSPAATGGDHVRLALTAEAPVLREAARRLAEAWGSRPGRADVPQPVRARVG